MENSNWKQGISKEVKLGTRYCEGGMGCDGVSRIKWDRLERQGGEGSVRMGS